MSTTTKPATVLPIVTKEGVCATCGRDFTWEAKGGRGRSRDYCSTVCGDFRHDLDRLVSTLERLTFPTSVEGRDAASEIRGELFVMANQFQAMVHATKAARGREDRVVRSTVIAAVVCPKCNAGIGEACKSTKGKTRTVLHPERWASFDAAAPR